MTIFDYIKIIIGVVLLLIAFAMIIENLLSMYFYIFLKIGGLLHKYQKYKIEKWTQKGLIKH